LRKGAGAEAQRGGARRGADQKIASDRTLFSSM